MKMRMPIAIVLVALIITLPIALAQETSNVQKGAESAKKAAKEVASSAKDVGKKITQLKFEPDTTKGIEEGETGEAIIVNVVGYDPSTVKSSLLEDDDIPVYVFLSGTTLGSLIGAQSSTEPVYGMPNIKHVTVRPSDIGTKKSIKGTPRYIRPKKYSLENLGFLAMLLKRVEKEEAMPDEINLSMIAEIFFEDAERTFSLFHQDLLLPEFADEGMWRQEGIDDSFFFAKRGAIRVSKIGDRQATFVLYSGSDLLPPYTGSPRPFKNINLRVGQTSDYYRIRESTGLMQNAFRVKLLDIVDPSRKRVKIRLVIDGTIYEKIVTEGARLYPGSEWLVKRIDTSIDKSKAQVTVRLLLTSSKGTETAQKTFFTKKSPTAGEQQTKTDPCASRTVLIDSMITDAPTSLSTSTKIVSLNMKEKSLINLDSGSISNVTVKPIKKGHYINIEKIEDSGVTFTVYNIPADTNTFPSSGEATYTLKDTPLPITVGGKQYNLLLKEKIPASGYLKLDVQIPASQVPQAAIDSASLNSGAQNAQTFVDKLKDINQEFVLCTAVQEYKKIFSAYPGHVDDKGVPLEDIAAFRIAEAYDWLGYPEQAMEFYKKSLKSKLGDHVVKAEAKIAQLEKDINEKASYIVARLEDVGREVEVKVVDVLGIKEEEKPHATFDVQDEGTKKLSIGTEIFKTGFNSTVKGKNYPYNWVVARIDSNSVVVSRKFKDKPPYTLSSSKTVSMNRRVTLDGKVVYLKEIDTKKFALVTIIPGTGRPLRSLSNFTIHIPIEKRPTKLTPEKLLDKINSTEKVIETLTDIIDGFDEILTLWKKVCIFTFLYLTIKNSFLSGTSRNIARSMVMRGKDGNSGWHKYCKVNSGKNRLYSNFDECVRKNEEKLNTHLDESQRNIEQVNDEMKDYKNQAWYKEAMSKYEKFGKYGELMGRDLYSKNTWRDYRYWQLMKDSSAYQQNQGQKEGKGIGYNFKKEVEDNLKSFEFDKSVSQFNDAVKVLEGGKYPGFDSKSLEERRQIFQDLITQSAVKAQDVRSNQFLVLSKMDVKVLSTVRQRGSKIVSYSADGEIELRQATVEDYITALDQMRLKYKEGSDEREFLKKHKENIAKSFANRLQSPLTSTQGAVYFGLKDKQFYVFKGSLTVTDKIRKNYDPLAPLEYYPDGKPYCVPTTQGNFIKILDYFTDGTPKTIQEWNVGSDGRLCTGDDVLLKHHSVLLRPEHNSHYRKLLTIANKFAKKKKGQVVSVGGKKWIVSNNAAGLRKDARNPTCYDTMDPGDCQTLFGVCDPVICPPSRFNLDGNWKVDNVVQTGIIGSLFLGIHNFNIPHEPVPICLTGISAGLKSIRSVLEGYVRCLKIAYTQGKTVGICDKIRSVYICEIIWREALALFKVKGGILKWLANKISGTTGKGGGEYLTFQSSFKNAQDSANFFFKQYSTSAFAAFNSRSTSEIGTTICKKAIYGKIPNFGDMLDQLATPEDPPQYTALMSVSPYSENLGLDQYQVYYHIYAGKTAHAPVTRTPGFFDQGGVVNKGTSAKQGVDYSVFLKNDLGHVFYVTEKCKGRRAFIKRGGLADHTVDCVAKKGFNQVCININGDIKCGFGKISTSFAINYVNDLIVASEAKRNIDSEEECAPTTASGSPSLLAAGLATQAGITPPGLLGALSTGADFAKTGIRRVCSIDNPGKGTNPNNFKVVGTCGKDAHGNELGACWIDLRSISIKDASRFEDVKKTFDEDTMKRMKQLAGVKDTLDKTQSIARLNELNNMPQTTCKELYTVLVGYRDLERKSLSSEVASKAQYKYAYTIDQLARDPKCSKVDPERVFRQLVTEYENRLIDIRANFFKEILTLQNQGLKGDAFVKKVNERYAAASKEMDFVHIEYLKRLRSLAKKENKEALTSKYQTQMNNLLSQHKKGLTPQNIAGVSIKPVPEKQIKELEKKCNECRKNSLDLCKDSECHSLAEHCYYYQTDPKVSVLGKSITLNPFDLNPMVGRCSTCPKATKCSDFNYDKKMCEDSVCARLRNLNCKYLGIGKGGKCYSVDTKATPATIAGAEKKCAQCHDVGLRKTLGILGGSTVCSRDECKKQGTECYYNVEKRLPECHHCSHAKDCSLFKTMEECNRGCVKTGLSCTWDGSKCSKKKSDCSPSVKAYYDSFPGAKYLATQGYYISPTAAQSSDNTPNYPSDTYKFSYSKPGSGSWRHEFLMKQPLPSPTFVPTGSPTYSGVEMTGYYTPYDDQNRYYKGSFNAEVRLQGAGMTRAGKCVSYTNLVPHDCAEPQPYAGTAIGVNAAKVKGAVAVNPNKGTQCYIPYGSYVYIKYKKDSQSKHNGWYVAVDTGGAFKGKCKIDVYSGEGEAGLTKAGSVTALGAGADVWVYPVRPGTIGTCEQPSTTITGATTGRLNCPALRDSSGRIINRVSLSHANLKATKFSNSKKNVFDQLYGKLKLYKGNDNREYIDKGNSELDDQIVKIDFLGKEIQVHKKTVNVFKCVEQEIKEKCGLNSYPLKSTSSWRQANSISSISRHMYGIAFDYNPSENRWCTQSVFDKCQAGGYSSLCCSSNPKSRYKLPKCHVDAFRKYGFMWGGEWGANGLGYGADYKGKWASGADFMHFEFRSNPDQLPDNFGAGTGQPTTGAVVSGQVPAHYSLKKIEVKDVFSPSEDQVFDLDFCAQRSNVDLDCMIEFSYKDEQLLTASARNANLKSTRIWVPNSQETKQGGSFPLLIMFHGIDKKPWENSLHPNLGGSTTNGKQFYAMAGDLIKGGFAKPIIIAAPSQNANQNRESGRLDYPVWNSKTWWAPNGKKITRSFYLFRDFDVEGFINEVEGNLPTGIKVDRQNIIFMGHSGGGCNNDGGVIGSLKKYRNAPSSTYTPKHVLLSETCFGMGSSEFKTFLSGDGISVSGVGKYDRTSDHIHNLRKLNKAMGATSDVSSGDIPCVSGVYKDCKKNNNGYFGYMLHSGTVKTLGSVSSAYITHSSVGGVLLQHFLLKYYGTSQGQALLSGSTSISGSSGSSSPSVPTGATCKWSGKKVAAVGDSLTALREYKGSKIDWLWPDKLKEKCPDVTFEKVGDGGYSSRRVRNEFMSSKTAQNFDVIIIMAGINDLTYTGSTPDPEKTKSNLRDMYKEAKASGKYVVALTIGPWKGLNYGNNYKWTAERQGFTDDINLWITSKPEGIDEVINTANILGDSADRDKIRSDYDLGDHLHYSKKGQGILADAIYEKIFKLDAHQFGQSFGSPY